MKRMWTVLPVLLLCLMLSACGSEELKAKEAAYTQAQALFQEEKYDEAEAAFLDLGTYNDSKYMLSEIKMARDYEAAIVLLESKDYPGAYAALCALGEYKDVPELLERFQIVELTTENWDTYYEIVEELDLDPLFLSAEGFYQRIPIYHSVVLREGIRERFYAPQENSMTAKIQATSESKDFHLDTQTGEYFFSDSEEWVYRNQKTHMAELHGDQTKEKFISGMIYSETDTGGNHLYYSSSPWSDFHVQEVEGRLYLYMG